MNPAKLQSTLQTALAHHRAGRLAQAATLYDQVRKAAPKLFDPVHLAGTVAYQQNRYEDAVGLLTRALSLEPKSAPCAMRLGLAYLGLGKPVEAERQLRASLSRGPSAEAWNGLGLTLRALGRPADAIDALKQAVVVQPTLATAHDQLGALIADTAGFPQAIPHFQRAVELDPSLAIAWCNLGLAQAQTGALGKAVVSLDHALALEPGMAQAHLGKALVHQKANRIEDAVAGYTRALSLFPSYHEAQSARLLCLNYLDTISAKHLFTEHRAFGESVEAALPPARLNKPAPQAEGGKQATTMARLKIAFLSPDLRAHSVAYFLEPILKHLDRSQFEVVLYHDHAVTDAMSARLRSFADLWRNFASQPHSTVEQQIRADAPDVLVDLAGHTGFNRLPLFARRLARVQVTYLGYPNTTGLRAMDFKLTDEHADPPGMSDACHTESLIRFASTAWSYQPPTSAPDVPPPPCFKGAPVTFGSFNNAAKFSRRTLQLWAKLLARVPGSRLLLKGHGLEDPEFAATLSAPFRDAGIAPERLELAPRTAGLDAHLALYGRIDIALDTFPYHGTTTTCEALWMGRPVVTLAGDRHASRVGVSLLTAAGHAEWVTRSDADYLDCAAALAGNPDQLMALAGTLRFELAKSALLDHGGQAQLFAEAIQRCVAHMSAASPATAAERA